MFDENDHENILMNKYTPDQYLKITTAGVCKTLRPQLPDSNTA